MRFAVVDIETTGGFPSKHGITEIAIVLMNGAEVEGIFETLINPGQPIPPFIANMTGISDAMVAMAPPFEEQAEKIYRLLSDRIFVAHNVNFDHSFVKYYLQQAGYQLQVPKICTIRLARKVFPGHKKYGLGHLTRALDIPITNRHRAGGDARATAEIVSRALAVSGSSVIKEMLSREAKHQLLPPNLSVEEIHQLPLQPGVYYFRDKKGKVMYVGKAKQLRKRVVSHFTGLDTSEKRQALLRTVYTIGHSVCASEFMASILESIEIKRLWPPFNKSQKRFEANWSIYQFTDSKGFHRLAIDKKHRHTTAISNFGLLTDAHRTLWKLVRDFSLHPYLCFLEKTPSTPLPNETIHNLQMQEAIAYLVQQPASFIIKDKEAIVLVEKGRFYGMGMLAEWTPDQPISHLREQLTQYPENEVIRSLVQQFTEKYPEKVYPYSEAS
jgi:DNA polymerase-3 subunit epsilon